MNASETRSPGRPRKPGATLGLSRLIVALGVFSAAVFSLMLFVVATVQAYLPIISTGMYSLFVSPMQTPPPLRVYSFDDLKQKLIGIVVVAPGVDFFSVALGSYSVILAKHVGYRIPPEDDAPHA